MLLSGRGLWGTSPGSIVIQPPTAHSSLKCWLCMVDIIIEIVGESETEQHSWLAVERQ